MAKKTTKKAKRPPAKLNAKPAKAKKAVHRRPAKKVAAGSRPKGPSPRQQFLDAFRHEVATTLKVLRAFPADQGSFRPHERSASATQLAWTFAVEQGVTEMLSKGPLQMTGFPPAPATFGEAVAAFERGAAAIETFVARASDAVLAKKVQFPVGPRAMGEFPLLQVGWMMLMDQIHHRGQLSVYVRMAGGKVPSIYGPSADEPWS